jgi:glycyl-tRNA synthetase alpha subunit
MNTIEWDVIVKINVEKDGSGVKHFKFIEGSHVSECSYEITRLVERIFAVRYDDADLLDIETIQENGDSTTLASLVLNDETEQLIAEFADMSAGELLANLAKYRSGEL